MFVKNKSRIIFIVSVLLLGIIVVYLTTSVIQKRISKLSYSITGTALFDGEGTKDNPYQVRWPWQIKYMADSLTDEMRWYDTYFIMMNDVDMSGEYEQVAIGSLAEGLRFGGYLDGNGYTISGLHNTYGMFEVLDGIVTNLTINNSTFSDGEAGAIAAVLGNDGRIINCRSFSDKPIAGICYGEITNSIFEANAKIGDVSDLPKYAYPRDDSVFARFDEPEVKHSFIVKDEQYIPVAYNEMSENTKHDMKLEIVEGSEQLSAAEVTDSLNKYLGSISPDYALKKWDDDAIPGKSASARIGRAYISYRRGGVDTVLEGFFSQKELAWYFVLPFGNFDRTENVSVNIVAGTNHTVLEIPYETVLSDGGYEFDYLGTSYKLGMLVADDTETIFMDSDNGRGVGYLYAEKANSLSGGLTTFDSNGNVLYRNTVKSISGRGNDSYSTSRSRKNSYALQLRGEEGILGLPANDDFVLLGGFRFTSIYSYMLERDLMQSLNIPYIEDYRIVNLYIDNEYQGLYMLTGSQEIAPDRYDLVDLNKKMAEVNARSLKSYEMKSWMSEDTLASKYWYDIPNNADDITGGYLLELDIKDYPDSRSRFTTDLGFSVTLKGNSYASKEQVDYISGMFQRFEDAVMSPDGYNSEGGYYADYIDIESFARQLLLFELSQDTSMSGSYYFYKDADSVSDGKIHGSWHWDIERSFIGDEKVDSEFSWVFGERHNYMKRNEMQCISALFEHEDFVTEMQRQWKEEFMPAVRYLCMEDAAFNPDGASSPYYYIEEFAASAKANNLRWRRCDEQEKAEEMVSYFSRRIPAVDRYFSHSYEEMRAIDEQMWKK